MSRLTQDTTRQHIIFVYGAITLYGKVFQNFSTNNMQSILQSYNPKVAKTTLVWAVPISLAATQGITIVLFSSGYLDVSVLRVCAMRYIFNVAGCPIRKSTDRGMFAPPRSLSQLITSFIASESQGIRHTPLIAFKNYYSVTITFQSIISIFQRTFSINTIVKWNSGE